jgi:hypothetical protein
VALLQREGFGEFSDGVTEFGDFVVGVGGGDLYAESDLCAAYQG